MLLSPREVIIYFYHWVGNVCLKLLKLKKRDKSLWLFGAWEGQKYSDNPKYFFEYILRKRPDIRAVWITKNKSVKAQLTAQGRECYLSRENKARNLRLKAGFVFIANGMTDIGNFDLCQGAEKVCLGHGMPFKKYGFTVNYLQNRERNLRRTLKYWMCRIYFHLIPTVAIATSQKAKELLMKIFRLNAEAVHITGQPRNDVLFDKEAIAAFKKSQNHLEGESFILYMPTWRDSDKNKVSYIDSIIQKLYADESFLKSLETNRIKLYVKPHPKSRVTQESRGNIKLLKHKLNTDPQKLIAAADILITDYSSVFIDYALTDRPIHFFVSDLEEYKKSTVGIFFGFDRFARYWFKDIDTLKSIINGDPEKHQLGLKNTQKINEIYDAPQLRRGHYCQTVLEILEARYL